MFWCVEAGLWNGTTLVGLWSGTTLVGLRLPAGYVRAPGSSIGGGQIRQGWTSGKVWGGAKSINQINGDCQIYGLPAWVEGEQNKRNKEIMARISPSVSREISLITAWLAFTLKLVKVISSQMTRCFSNCWLFPGTQSERVCAQALWEQVSVFYSPTSLLYVSSADFQGQMLWGFLFSVQVSQAEEPDVGLRPIVPHRDLLGCDIPPTCGSLDHHTGGGGPD